MSESTSNKGEISLEDLSPAQLVAIRNQLEQDILMFKGSFSQLKVAQQKFSSCIESIESLDKSNNLEGKQSLIPVTNSLFLKGYIENSSKVLVDIGTGYWMEKNHSQAIAYYKSKVERTVTGKDKFHECYFSLHSTC